MSNNNNDNNMTDDSFSDRTCHALPCEIDYQGMAPTHVYFRPVEHDDDNIYSATFRGRGILAKDNNSSSEVVKAALISTRQDQFQIKAEMDQILEWKHEHHAETLKLESSENSRVHTAQEWLQVADAVSRR